MTIKNNPEKFDEIFPRLFNIAKTKPQHHAIIEAMVVCCVTAKRGKNVFLKENELIALLEESLDLSNINKEVSLHLFQFSTKKFAFTSQIKVF